MSITIIIPKGLQVFTGTNETVSVSGGTVAECLADLVRQYPAIEDPLFFEEGKLWDFGHNRVSVFLNNETILPNDLQTPVKDGDSVRIMLAISGG